MIQTELRTLEFDRSWQDAFGTASASVERGSRKRSVLIVTSSESGRVALELLAGIAFQGRIVLVILEHIHSAPLEAVLRDQKPNFVIALELAQIGIATHGPEIKGESSHEIARTGLEYVEPGSYPAWSNANALESDPQASSITGSIVGSVASSLRLRCLICNPSDLKLALEIAFQK
jgi:hypothetical protein